ncbi:RNase P subunit p30 family protein [Haloarcula laminariae]|uniref:RNase P subunit p30 family protein n=1 Tax=Haloarcula laminariae TaxID=2961577 RepID=UPI0021C66F24|nr:RNase P subunit p30 family protein [Halomicroarcula laminariae]
MYEAVHARPDGPSTVARQARTAADYGFDGVVVRNHGDEGTPDRIAGLADDLDVDVVDGIEVRAADPSQASGLVGNYRSKRTVVVVHGGDSEINRFAVENPAVDVLAHPMAGDGDFNHVLAKAAADNGVRVEFSFHPVIHGEGGSRVRRLRGLRKLRELVDDADAPYVVSADPRSHLELRAPRELVALGETVGFDADAIRNGLAEWGRLAARNRDRQGDAFVEPGVRREDS